MGDFDLTFVSAYAGVGGLDYGFEQAGFRPVWTSELDPDAAASYKANLGHEVAVGDIRRLEMPDAGAADVVIGGPPMSGLFGSRAHGPEGPPQRARHLFS